LFLNHCIYRNFIAEKLESNKISEDNNVGKSISMKEALLKSSVQRDEWGVGHMYVQFLLVWDSRDRDWFEFLWRRCLLTSIFLFPTTPVKLIGQIEII